MTQTEPITLAGTESVTHGRPSALPGRRLDDIFAARARAAPARVAVRTLDDQIITYGELNDRAEAVAHRLRHLGIGPNVPVGLCAARTIDMLVGMLGILKAGGAYVPIDPAYPPERVQFMLRDSAAAAIVADALGAKSLEDNHAPVVRIDRLDVTGDHEAVEPARVRETNDLAYVIYTSGSTGVPKGVLIEHANVVRLFEQTDAWFQFGSRDVWTLFHSICFDFSVWEIWGAWLYGGQLVVVPTHVTRSPHRFLDVLEHFGVTVLNQTPSAFRQLVAADAARSRRVGDALRLVIFGGERLDLKVLEPWVQRYGLEQPRMINMYGITETTVHVTFKPLSEADFTRLDVSPIGVPIPDLSIHVLDSAGKPVQEGVTGELYVGGPGLARGYLNRPELTAERFIRRPGFEPNGARLYRSGDRVVRSSNGELAYVGRADDQLKLRGHRIEPVEIEACLTRHPLVATCIVAPVDYGEGDVRLLAYVVPRLDVGLTDPLHDALVEQLRTLAGSALPPHMRPSNYRFVRTLPMTAQGKVDRRALSRLQPMGGSSVENDRSLTLTEQVVLGICEKVLQSTGIGLDVDLFDQGATSLAFVRILMDVNRHFKLSLMGSELGDTASVHRLAACVDSAAGAEARG